MAGAESMAALGACFPMRNTKRGIIVTRAKLVLGASGAVATTSDYPDPAFTFTLSSTGTYAVKFPPCSEVDMYFSVYSPAATINGVIITALNASAGTATIVTMGDTAAAEPASGDAITVLFRAVTEV
jgi:hypothetical protein